MQKFATIICLFILVNTFAQPLYFPPKNNSTWDTISPHTLGWCNDDIDSLYTYLGNANSDAFIYLKNGKIVLEKYFGSFTADSIHYWASAGKSLTAMMIGIAQQKGKLNINDTVSKYLGTSWTSESLEKENKITIKHLLTMTSGLDDNPTQPCDNLSQTATCLQYKADAGTRWAYHSGAYRKLEDVITAANGTNYNTATYDWLESKTGMNGFWFNSVYYSNARDMARYGLLTLNRGIWQADTVLNDTSYFRAMINTSQNKNLSYGYLWWLNGKNSVMLPGTQTVFPTKLIPNAPDDLFCALGKNDQKIYVIPSTKTVIVRFGDSNFGNDASSPFDTMLWNYINRLDNSCLTTAVIQQNKSNTVIKLFPNPANNFISFSGFVSNNNIHYAIANMLGEIVKEDVTLNHSIDISDLPSGQYYMLLNDDMQQASKQFIKL